MDRIAAPFLIVFLAGLVALTSFDRDVGPDLVRTGGATASPDEGESPVSAPRRPRPEILRAHIDRSDDAPDEEAHTVPVIVRDDRGRPWAGAEVIWRSEDVRGALDERRTVFTDTNGRAEIEVPAGRRTVRVQASAAAVVATSVTRTSLPADLIEVRLTRGLAVAVRTLHPSSVLYTEVRPTFVSGHGRRIEPERLTATGEESGGAWTRHAFLVGEGRYSVEVHGPDGRLLSTLHDVWVGEGDVADSRLERIDVRGEERVLEVEFIRTDGAPAARSPVAVGRGTIDTSDWAATDAEGRVRITTFARHINFPLVPHAMTVMSDARFARFTWDPPPLEVFC